MSKWGHVSKSDAKYKFEHFPDDAFEMVVEMATTVISHEKANSALQEKVQDLQTQMMFDRAAAAELNRNLGRLEGYRDRVREVDGMEEVED